MDLTIKEIGINCYLVLHELLSMLPLLVARFLKEPGGTNVQNTTVIIEETVR
jgi:hypothetical protein